MHSLGDSFGFRRSDEDLHSGAESNFKVPATQVAEEQVYLQGDLVEIDSASPGYVVRSAADAPLVPGVRGLLVQYGQLLVSAGLTRNTIFQTRDLSEVVLDAPTVIVTGAGIKVWVKNLDAVAAGTGRRTYAAEERCDTASVTLGSLVKWDGNKFVHTTDADKAVGTVTSVTADGFEFVLNA